jgi:hypothetical protein
MSTSKLPVWLIAMMILARPLTPHSPHLFQLFQPLQSAAK